MEAKDMKNIWKSGVNSDILSYSEPELAGLVVKSARKSIKAVYPGVIFRFVVIAIVIYIIAMLIFADRSRGIMLLDLAALFILSVSYLLWERSAYTMRRYTYGMPVKEWLEYRIREIEKSVRLKTKYRIAIYGFTFLLAVGFYALYQLVGQTPPSLFSVIVIPVGLVVYLWIVNRSLNRNYRKTLEELKELYKQFE